MSTKTRISKALSVVLPAGAVGASFLLALSSAHATTPPDSSSNGVVEQPGVAARLEAIRAGITEDQTSGGALVRTWWGNGGWGRWRLGWGNGGWGNGGWHNWHNWGNGGWGNGGWHNGWHNFWHNW